jgi:hypothetical protein
MASLTDAYRMTLVATWNNEPVLNTLYYWITAVGTGDEKAALATAWLATVKPSWLACFSANYVLQQLLVQPVKPVGTVEAVAVTGGAGTVGGNDNVSQAAVILTRKTNIPGKGGRGRIFMGPVPLAFTGVTNPDQASLLNYNVLIPNLMAILASGGWSFAPVLWKRKTSSPIVLTGFNANTMVRTRRSRAIATRFHRRRKHTVGSI